LCSLAHTAAQGPVVSAKQPAEEEEAEEEEEERTSGAGVREDYQGLFSFDFASQILAIHKHNKSKNKSRRILPFVILYFFTSYTYILKEVFWKSG
jgi:hypothetical protein